jgi:hypothetical protein
MKNSAIFLCLCLISLAHSSSVAQTPASREPLSAEIPPVIFDGLHQLANQKPEEAEKAWFRGTLPDGQPAPSDLPIFLANGNFGLYQNFDVVSAQDLTPRIRVLYLALNFQRQPIIVKFMLYRTTDGWILLFHKIGIDEDIFESVAPAHD